MNVSREGYIDLSDVKYVEATNYEPLLAGDVLFNNTNSPELVGKTSFIKHNAAWAYSNHMTRVRFYDGTVAPGWVAYSLHYLFLSGYFKLHCTNHVNQASINSGFLAERVQIPLPPAAEQYHIVAEIEKHFSRLDAAVKALKRVQANLRRYRASVLKAACEGRLVPQDPNDEPASELLKRILAERQEKWETASTKRGTAGGSKADSRGPGLKYEKPNSPNVSGLPQLPAGWCWVTVDQLIVERPTNGRSVRDAPDGKAGFPVLRLTAMRGGRLELGERKIGDLGRDELANFIVREGDFFVARGNGSVSLVGRGALAEGIFEDVAFPDTMIRLRFWNSQTLKRYVRAIWDANVMRRQIETTARTTAGIYKINQEDIRNFVVPLPPLAEQQRISDEIERLLTVVNEVEGLLEINLKRAERLRQSILKRAFEGRLVPQDPNDEPASVMLERIRAERRAATGDGRRPRAKQLPLPE